MRTNPNHANGPAPYHDTPVIEFHAAFGHPVEFHPTAPTIEQRLLRVKLIAEELTEFAKAANVCLQIEQDALTGAYVIQVMKEDEKDLVDLAGCADGLGDLRYVIDGGNLIFGFPGERIFWEIHASNMSKLDADGRPITREDGKTLKGPNYQPPRIGMILGWSAGSMLSADLQGFAGATPKQITDGLLRAQIVAGEAGAHQAARAIAAGVNLINGLQRELEEMHAGPHAVMTTGCQVDSTADLHAAAYRPNPPVPENPQPIEQYPMHGGTEARDA